MGPVYFLAGFFTAFSAGLAALFLAYRHQKRKQRLTKKARGYLDLIPDLAPHQREQVEKIRQTFLPRVAGIREDLKKNRANLADLLFSEPADRARIQAVAAETARHQSELEQEIIEHILEEKALLTPPQRKKFREIILGQFASGGLGIHDVPGRGSG